MALNEWGNKPKTDYVFRKDVYHGTFFGIVKDNKDPQKMGRLRVWIPELCSPAEEEQGWVVATYCSPFAGATNYDRVERTGATENDPANSQTSYGFWMVPPDINNTVVVMFVNGDPNKAIWIGCLYQQKINHMVPGVPYGNTFDTEDKRPTTEHNRRTNKTVTDDMQRAEIIDGMSAGLKNQGLIQDHARGITDSGARREFPSEVYGILTPGPKREETVYIENERPSRYGGSQFVMDDGEAREKIRLRTRSGAQLLLDESNGTVYLTNRDGTAWVHMDEFGRIDIYGAETMSVRSEKDFVVRADRDIVMEAGRDVSIKANRDWKESESGTQHAGEVKGEGGNIILHANKDLGIITTQDLTATVNENMYVSVGNDSNTIVHGKSKTQVDKSIDTIVNTGNYTLSINGKYQHNTGSSTEMFAGDSFKIDALNDIEQFAFSGKIDMGSQLDLTMKSKKGDISVNAEDAKSNLTLRSNNAANQIVMSNPHCRVHSNGSLAISSKEETTCQTNEGFDVNDKGEITIDGAPLNGGCLRFDGGVNISFSKKKIEFDAVDDIAMKVQSGISDVNNKIDTSVKTINKGMEKIEETVNKLSEVTYNYISKMMTFFKIPNVLDWIKDLPIEDDIPIPSFELPQIPSITFPSLKLPEFPFDFCIDLGSIIKIGEFNLLPDTLFSGINIDLGNWSKRTIKDWVNNQKNGFKGMVEGLRIDKQISAAFNREISKVKSEFRNVRNSLNNLVSFGVSVSDNAGIYKEYSVGLGNLRDSLVEYRDKAKTVPDSSIGSSTPIADGSTDAATNIERLISEVDSQQRNVDRIARQAELNSEEFNQTDFSELEEFRDFFDEILDELDEFVDDEDIDNIA